MAGSAAQSSADRFDVAVVGAGAAGLVAGLAVAEAGFRTAVVGPPPPPADGRTVALLDGSVRLLRALEVWDAVAPHAAPLAALQIIDDTGSLFRPPPVRFAACEIGLDAFGWNVESDRLVEALRAAAGGHAAVTLIDAAAESLTAGPDRVRLSLADRPGSEALLEARLVVAADGARSLVRREAGIAVRDWSYPQAAVTTLLAHARGHEDVSTEFHTREGPFTLVPLPGGHRSSLVWVARKREARRLAALDDAALAAAIERRCGHMLGRVRVDGPRGLVPMRGARADRMIGARVVLVGEAAHVFPPIGAQGLNLGLRDAAALRDALVAHREDPGSTRALEAYSGSRRLDVSVRGRAIDLLNRSLLADLLPVDLLRGAGLLALATLGPLRRAVMREGVLPKIGAPALMRQ